MNMLKILKQKVKLFLIRKLFHQVKEEDLNRVIDICENYTNFKELIASFSILNQEFKFNPKRLSFPQIYGLFKEISEDDIYCLDMASKKKAVIVDIGMHIGVLPFVANNKLLNSKIYCVEPDRDNMDLAKLNLYASSQKNKNEFFFIDKAIGSKKGKLQFFTSNKVDWRSTLIEKKDFLNNKFLSHSEFSSSYSVEVETLGGLLSNIKENHIDIIKMTVGGAIEADILENGFNEIKNKRPKVFALFVYPENQNRIYEIFESLGYTEHKIVRNGQIRVFINNF